MSLPEGRFEGSVSFDEPKSWSGSEPPAAAQDPLLGVTLHDTYVVSGVLGEGGMGRVYEAHHTRIASKRYAIKVLHAEFSLDPEIRQRFAREAEAAATIEHDGVVGTYDVGKTPDGRPYMVCEYLSGLDLNDYLKARGALPAATTVHIGKQLCSALRAAHSHGVIHRDLKPHNVFVIKDHDPKALPADGADAPPELPLVKVLDFGLSRFVEKDNELTKAGIILGTPGYMSPEQANGKQTDARVDIYGIGALLYASATGRPPFSEETPQLTVLAVMNREPARPRELVPSIPVDLEIVIQRAMARDPDERYQSAGAMEDALSALHAASTPLNRRAPAPVDRVLLAPRLSFVFYALSALALGALSLLGALLALLEIKGVDYINYRPSILEWLLFVLLGLVVLFLMGTFLRRFGREVWHNSARVAALVPRVRGPLLAAVFAYGASALVVRSGAVLSGLGAGNFTDMSVVSRTVLFVILPLNATLAATAVVLRDVAQRATNTLFRALVGVGYSAGALMAGLLLLGLVFTFEPPNHRDAYGLASAETKPKSTAPSEPRSANSSDAPPTAPAEVPLAEVPEPQEESTEPAAQPDGRAPSADLAVAAENGAEALEQLAEKYPDDSRIFKSLVLAHASRADTLDRAARAIGQLVELDPEYKQDKEVLFILKKALRVKGQAFSEASSTIKNRMGQDGAEVLFQVMVEHPDQRSRLQDLFQELRKANMVSEALLIAYDLRYAPSCRGRLDLLDRAEQFGDIRSLQQLKALSTAPKRCGWGRTCHPPCRAEAERFRKSLQAISKRLDEPQP